MATDSHALTPQDHSPVAGLAHDERGGISNVVLGMLLFITSEVMFFSGLFAAYFSTRAHNAGSAVWECGASVGMCTYPATTDLSCYRLPEAGTPPNCPANTQSGKTACTTMCSICSGYVDSGGAPKTGYCSCSGTATDDAGVSGMVYQCASTTEWPPQNR